MASPFRFAPPVLRPDCVTRPRLLRALTGRFDRRCTVIVGGAGHGKTTLLAQALAENRLAPRGDDVWLSLEPSDAEAGVLARDLLIALDADGEPTAASIGDAVWRRAPTELCLVLDDVHALPVASGGRDLLAELLDMLPANAHVVVASRTPQPLPYARLASHGAVLEVAEADLRFDDRELAEFATTRHVDSAQLHRSHGWPAMAELLASAGDELAFDFLWQEVLEPIGAAQRHLLAVLCDLGGGDDQLLSAAIGETVQFDASVPMVAVNAQGWFEPHALWKTVTAVQLSEAERVAVRRRAAQEHLARQRLDAAFTLLADAGLWRDVPAVLRTACRAGVRPAAGQLRRWLSRCPDDVVESPSGQLARGVLAALSAPTTASEPLRRAAEGFRAEGDVEGELSAISHLGHIAWWHRDLGVLADLAPRVTELESVSPTARGLAAIGRALVCNIGADNEGVLAALAAVPSGALDATWDAVAGWMRGLALLNLGDTTGFVAELEVALPVADPAFQVTVRASLTMGRWGLGEIAAVPTEAASLLEAAETSGIAADIVAIAGGNARACAYLGDVAMARHYLTRARGAAANVAGQAPVHVAVAQAAVLVAERDEQGAAAVLRSALEQHPFDDARVRGTWIGAVALVYVLVPEMRAAFDAAISSPTLARSRDLAAAVVAAREGGVADPLARVDVSNPALVRATLPFPFAAEVAVLLHDRGRRAEAARLLEQLREPGRAHARTLRTPAAKALLAAVPAAPPTPVTVRAFGSLEVAGRPVERGRVQQLLGYLLLHRDATRAALTAALWPDLDDRAAANNMRVTLSHLSHMLEPDRTEGEATYFVRQEGGSLRLVVDDALDVDLDAFDRHVDAALAAETDGMPSVALDHALVATELYRGELLAGVADAPWADLERERFRSRFVMTAVRAGELLVAASELDRATCLAERALAVDEWSEPAFGVLTAAALARGDRSGALRILDRCDAMLDDLGVEASEATERLRRRARSA